VIPIQNIETRLDVFLIGPASHDVILSKMYTVVVAFQFIQNMQLTLSFLKAYLPVLSYSVLASKLKHTNVNQ
jgi:hypothetical protein